MKQDQQTVVIAGASSGLGKGTARRLAEKGANLVLGARRLALLEELAKECGPNAVAVEMDIGRQEDVQRLHDIALERFGRIDAWINMAGVGLIGPYTELPENDLKRIVDTNVLGTMYGSQHALRQFKQQKSGTLINLGSVASKVAFPYYTAYSATKFAVEGLTESLHQEIKLEEFENIHVCMVHPWATDTPWFEHAGNYSGHAAEMKPMDDPENVIEAIVDLLDNPQKSVEVGAKTKGSSFSKNLLPGITDAMNAKYVQSVIQDAPPAPPSPGSLHEPMGTGTEVSAGMRERMKKEQQ